MHQNKLRSSTSRVLIPCWTTVSDNGEACASFKVCLESPHSSTTVVSHASYACLLRTLTSSHQLMTQVYRRFGKFNELHTELIKQWPNLEIPVLPHFSNTPNASVMEEQRIALENYLNRIVHISECWSCSCFGSFFCVQIEVSAAELTNSIVSRILLLSQENVLLSDHLKATKNALLQASAHIQQLESRISLLEHGYFGQVRAASSRSGSVSIGGDRITDGTPPLPYGTSKTKHRFSYVSTASDLDSITSNSVCFDDMEQLPSPHGERRHSSVPNLFTPDARKSRRPSEQRFSFAGDLLNEYGSDPRTVAQTLEFIPMQEELSDFDERIDNVLFLLLPQKDNLSQRSEVRNFVCTEIFKSLGVQALDVGHYRLRCFLPDEAIELGITIGADNENKWCEKLVQDFASLMCLEGSFDRINALVDNGADSSLVISNLRVTPPNNKSSGPWKLQFTVGSVAVIISTVSKADLCIIAFLEEVDKLVGRDHLFKRSVILIKAWYCHESGSITGSTNVSSNLNPWLLCSLMCCVYNKYHERIFHPLHAMILFFTEYAYFDWKSRVSTIYGAVPKKSATKLETKIDIVVGTTLLISDEVISKYRDLAMRLSSSVPRADEKDNISGWGDVTGIVVQHPLLSEENLFIDSAVDPDSTQIILGLKSGILLLCGMVNSKGDSIEKIFANTIARFKTKNMYLNPHRITVDREEASANIRATSAVKVLSPLSSWWNYGTSGSPSKDLDASLTSKSDDLSKSEVLTIPDSNRPGQLGSATLLNASRLSSSARASPSSVGRQAQVG